MILRMSCIARNLINSYYLILFSVILATNMQISTQAKDDTKNYKPNELVEIVKLDSTIKLDIRYATKNNFLKRPVYKFAKAYLQKPVAEDLIKVNKELKNFGYGLLVFDGYRPWSVTKIFWDELEPEKRIFVADPKKGSIHNRGCAVDLTLYDLKTGKSINMPSDYDEFSERAYPSYKGSTEEQSKNRDFLIEKMQNHNFKVHSNEWWHFDHSNCNEYKILDLTFEEIQ